MTRGELAEKNFKEGCNCAQAVFLAFSDLTGLDEATAMKIAASFGGGIGRMRATCGAACGMFMLAGLENGSAKAGDAEGKMQNYALVQDLAAKFRNENGSLICAELLSGVRSQETGTTNKWDNPTPEARTEEYYKKRPCEELVGISARIVGEKIAEMNK